MAATSVTLVASTVFGSASGNYDGAASTFNSVQSKGDGYFGYTDGLHTVAYYPNAFEGNIKMQATLAETPVEADWFDVTGTTLTSAGVATSTAVTYNFTGNFVWVRAVIDTFTAGTISRIQMNF